MSVKLNELGIEPHHLSDRKDGGKAVSSYQVNGKTYQIKVQKVQERSLAWRAVLAVILILGLTALSAYSGFKIGQHFHLELESALAGGAVGMLASVVGAMLYMKRVAKRNAACTDPSNKQNPYVDVAVTDLTSGRSIRKEARFNEIVLYNDKSCSNAIVIDQATQALLGVSDDVLEEAKDMLKEGMIPALQRSQ